MNRMRRDRPLTTLLCTVSLFGSFTPQRSKSPSAEFKPYPGSVQFCNEHVIGAPQKDGTPGAHISMTAYYSTDSPEKVAGHYIKTLGSRNHRREGNEDVWRFPLEKPESVLSVTEARGTFPRGRCSPPPRSARTVLVISTMARRD